MADITGILLAAGASRRFGANKLLAPLGARALVLHSAAALAPCRRLLAVIRADDRDLQLMLRAAGIETISNPKAALGMGTSIACGVKASARSDGWCILPADMPQVRPATTRRIMQALYSGAALAAPFYRGRRGHPVGFGPALAAQLGRLDGDIGARTLLREHAEQLLRVEVDDPGITSDIDTPAQLAIANSL